MKQLKSRRNFLNGAVGLSLLATPWFGDSADCKPMQARPGVEEPVSGSVLAGKDTLMFLVYQKRLSIELQRQDGSQSRCILPANQALLALLAQPPRDTVRIRTMNELFEIMSTIVDNSSATGKSEIVSALLAGRQK